MDGYNTSSQILTEVYDPGKKALRATGITETPSPSPSPSIPTSNNGCRGLVENPDGSLNILYVRILNRIQRAEIND